jgi:hypothetical protein
LNKQALRMAIAECYGLIENNLGINMTARDKERIACGAFGLHIIDLLLSDPEPTEECEIHIIQMDAAGLPEPLKAMIREIKRAENHKPGICPRCGNEEIGPGAKFCKICGLPLFVAKS